MRYPWGIIDAVKFEYLAFDYVRERYPEQDWSMLPLTGDGNRDVESDTRHYFFGESVDYASWVEAKYTQSLTRSLSKGRLDPTLVSALIEPNVGAVMFISNGCFNTAYINRAERALRVRHTLIPPRFIDGEVLEHWLDRVPRIARRYFRKQLPKRIPSTDRGAVAIRQGQIVAMEDYRAGHLEGRKALASREDYVLQLLVTATGPRTVRFKIDGSGLAPLSSREFPESISLQEGLTSVALGFTANRQVTRGTLRATVWDLVDDREDAKSIAYSILPEPVQVRSAGQLAALQRLADRLKNHQRIPHPHTVRLLGAAAAGKTWILSRIISYVPLIVPVRRYAFMENRSAHNAQIMCRALLFMTVGTAFEFEGFANVIGRQIRSEDISRDLFDWLLSGVSAPQKAQQTVSVLAKSDLLGPLFTQHARGDTKVLILDDIHKADEQTITLLKRLLIEFSESDNKTLIVLGSRPDVRTDIDEASLSSEVETIEISSISTSDVSETLSYIVGVDMADKIAQHFGPAISNILELHEFADSLATQSLEINALSVPALIRRCRDLLRDATVVGMVGCVRSKEDKHVMDFLFIADGGIEEEFVQMKFGRDVVERLLESRLIIVVPEDRPILVPKHDLIRDAYLARRRIYNDRLGDLLDSYMSWAPGRCNDLLGHLCRCGQRWRSRYLLATIKARDALIRRTQYGAARSVAEALYQLGEEGDSAGMTDLQRIEAIYAHADCTMHTKSARRSIGLFQQACTLASQSAPSIELYALKFQATAALFTARFWLLDTHGLPEEIAALLAEWHALPSEYSLHPRLLDGFLATLNRKMMVHFLHDRVRHAEAAFKAAFALTKRFNNKAHLAHLLMDKGKSLCLADPLQSLDLFEQAHSIYASLGDEERRLMVCASQMVFVKIILGRGHRTELEERADVLLRHGYVTEYVNALLELSAVSLIMEDVIQARHLLARVERNDVALESSRKLLMYHHVMSVLAFIERNDDAERLLGYHLEGAKSLGLSYLQIAKHNGRIQKCQRASWAHHRSQSSLWIDNRLW